MTKFTCITYDQKCTSKDHKPDFSYYPPCPCFLISGGYRVLHEFDTKKELDEFKTNRDKAQREEILSYDVLVNKETGATQLVKYNEDKEYVDSFLDVFPEYTLFKNEKSNNYEV